MPPRFRKLNLGSSVTVTQSGRPEESDPDIVAPEGYRLVWNDEFELGDTPDTEKWYYETAEPGWVNNELQTYVSGDSEMGRKCIDLSHGTLKISLIPVGERVYSIRMNTKEYWQYGYFEARLKLPTGKGT